MFKTFHVFTRFICRPVADDSLAEQGHDLPDVSSLPAKKVSHTMRLE